MAMSHSEAGACFPDKSMVGDCLLIYYAVSVKREGWFGWAEMQ